MRRWGPLLKRLACDRRAATAVEYCLILAMIVLAIIGAIAALGLGTGSLWNDVSTRVLNAH